MMDELDLLKKDWQKREKDLPKLSHDDIYKMIWQKSSSNIKWIFIISAIEFILGVIFTVFYRPAKDEFKLPLFLDIITWGSLVIAIYFIIRFYKNYKRVTATSTVKGLMDTIMKARKTVKHYIVTMISLGSILAITEAVIIFVEQYGGWDKLLETAELKDYIFIIGIAILLTALIMGILLGVYFLLYGILMRRLKRNYREIKKIEL